MSHWEYGIEFEINTGTDTLEFGTDLPAAQRRAQRMEHDRSYAAVVLVRRRVGDWEPVNPEPDRNTQ